jgi:transposase
VVPHWSVHTPVVKEGVHHEAYPRGVDLAKNVFQVHGGDRTEKPVWRRKLSRADWLKALLERIEPGCEIGMEAYGGAHHWARQLQAHGYTVKLVAPQFVKHYVRATRTTPTMPKPSVRR